MADAYNLDDLQPIAYYKFVPLFERREDISYLGPHIYPNNISYGARSQSFHISYWRKLILS